ncbi:hypothetical protein JGI25_01539, partial [Candidatus Kryptobacter tengchongensis]
STIRIRFFSSAIFTSSMASSSFSASGFSTKTSLPDKRKILASSKCVSDGVAIATAFISGSFITSSIEFVYFAGNLFF